MNNDVKIKNVKSIKNEKFDSKSKSNQFVDKTFSILKNSIVVSMTTNNITNFFDISSNDNDFFLKKIFHKKIFLKKFNLTNA